MEILKKIDRRVIGALLLAGLVGLVVFGGHAQEPPPSQMHGFVGTGFVPPTGPSGAVRQIDDRGSFSLTSEQSSTATGSASLALSSQVSLVRWTGAGDVTWTDWTGFRAGAMVLFINGTDTFNASFVNDNAGATKDFYTPLGVPLVCGPKSSTWVYYSSSANRWRPVGGAGCNPMPSTSPDGVVTAPKGATVTNRTTGIVWQNRNGGTRWDPVTIPPTWGYRLQNEFLDVLPAQSLIGGGSTSLFGTAATPGVISLAASAAGTDGVVIRHNVSGWNAGGGVFVVRLRVKIDTLSDGTNNVIVRAGVGDATTYADQTDGIYLEYDFAAHGDHNWWLCASSGGARTKVTTGIAATAAVWTTLEIRVNSDGTSVSAEIDGVAAPTPVTTNIPITDSTTTAAPAYVQMLKQLGAAARTVRLDWWDFWQILSVARGL